MSNFESKLKEASEKELKHFKELFNFDGSEAQLQHLKELFTNFMRNSMFHPSYFINFLNFYSKCRPNQHHICRELVKCVYSCFPEQINEIQEKIKKHIYSQIHHISRRVSNEYT